MRWTSLRPRVLNRILKSLRRNHASLAGSLGLVRTGVWVRTCLCGKVIWVLGGVDVLKAGMSPFASSRTFASRRRVRGTGVRFVSAGVWAAACLHWRHRCDCLDPNSSSTLRRLAGRRRHGVHAASLVGGRYRKTDGKECHVVRRVACGNSGGFRSELYPSSVNHNSMCPGVSRAAPERLTI